MIIIGRQEEQVTLQKVLEANEAQFIAVHGRRRVGKTYLIRNFYQPRTECWFSVTGLKEGSLEKQLALFQNELQNVFMKEESELKITSWLSALTELADCLEQWLKKNPRKKAVVFLDELPWMATPKSGLLQALDHTWNTRLSLHKNIRLIVCGSAASWMLDNIVHAKGGLHNRLTKTIRINPFTLLEAKQYFYSKKILFSNKQIAEIYMVMGGVPHYLQHLEKGYSATQNIDKICFEKEGFLREEFKNLYSSLFNESQNHENIVRALATKREGLSREEIIVKTGLSSGGTFASRLNELEAAGFIQSFLPYGKKSREKKYKLSDEYSLFYLKWIEPTLLGKILIRGQGYWAKKSQTPAFKAWSGYAFEALCFKHLEKIIYKLRLTSISFEAGSWRFVPSKNQTAENGAQIDLLFDREDGIINICEIKYSSEEFVIDKKYASELKEKMWIFEKMAKINKQTSLVLITTFGIKKNVWSEGLVDNVVTLNDLF